MFVRLSSRSPKDAALCRPGFARLFVSELSRLHVATAGASHWHGAGARPNVAANARLLALHTASTAALRLTGRGAGRDAVRLLVQSGRIQDDLAQYAAGRIAAAPGAGGYNVVVREFRGFDVAHEFRGFVHGGRLTALTQYNDLLWFPALTAPAPAPAPSRERGESDGVGVCSADGRGGGGESVADGLARLIQSEFGRIADRLPPALGSCVVDFVLCPRAAPPPAPAVPTEACGPAMAAVAAAVVVSAAAELDVRIIELNPFAEFAGSGLFDWVRDRSVLTGRPWPDGAPPPPPEFRYVRECPAGQHLTRLDGPWQRFLDLDMPEPAPTPGRCPAE
jgi:hypothetical protein